MSKSQALASRATLHPPPKQKANLRAAAIRLRRESLMQRVLIVGNSGGGKSTLSRRLGERLGLPVVHLDVLFWKPGWVESDKDEFKIRVAEALGGPAWICDGNFSSSFDVTMARADTIVWLDQPRLLCLVRAIWRALSYRHGGRPDMAEGCREKIDLKFYGYIWAYPRNYHPKLADGLARHGAHARLARLRSDREIATFLSQLDSANAGRH